MHIQNAIRLLRETCALQHLALNTEKSYTHWLARYAAKRGQLMRLSYSIRDLADLTGFSLG